METHITTSNKQAVDLFEVLDALIRNEDRSFVAMMSAQNRGETKELVSYLTRAWERDRAALIEKRTEFVRILETLR
jgi:hypothetical protein